MNVVTSGDGVEPTKDRLKIKYCQKCFHYKHLEKVYAHAQSESYAIGLCKLTDTKTKSYSQCGSFKDR